MRLKRLAVIAIITILGGCYRGSHTATTVALPPPTIVTVAVPVESPVPVPMDVPVSLPAPAGTILFEQAESSFLTGDYVAAIQDYEDYLQLIPNGDRVDQVLLHVGMAYVLRTKPPANWKEATTSLSRLVNEYPDSPLRPTASLILSLRSHADQLARDAKARNELMQQLNTELERLKKIDKNRGKRR
jgi:TolA-binding protein